MKNLNFKKSTTKIRERKNLHRLDMLPRFVKLILQEGKKY